MARGDVCSIFVKRNSYPATFCDRSGKLTKPDSTVQGLHQKFSKVQIIHKTNGNILHTSLSTSTTLKLLNNANQEDIDGWLYLTEKAVYVSYSQI